MIQVQCWWVCPEVWFCTWGDQQHHWGRRAETRCQGGVQSPDHGGGARHQDRPSPDWSHLRRDWPQSDRQGRRDWSQRETQALKLSHVNLPILSGWGSFLLEEHRQHRPEGLPGHRLLPVRHREVWRRLAAGESWYSSSQPSNLFSPSPSWELSLRASPAAMTGPRSTWWPSKPVKSSVWWSPWPRPSLPPWAREVSKSQTRVESMSCDNRNSSSIVPFGW